ncbi:PHP domain-containing protein [Thiocystis violascens]|uniref:Putative metal-dependent phosphoesterase, PHP family n=1 Tax=Thiocystis violascens (strain ATCC 17096 / DSM 198 / 6111) TaxID=765911 RepID=I3Y864_THIV6|nr:PHP domain-containing protein [Thiocystis violascens]AFL73182.1 putative metal-dependent phosphoesterase, PHP family [Thiocystis violascens DSM 198]
MNSKHDLHTHSTASDGTLTPDALVRRAAAAGVTVMALTDHDTTEGVAEADAAARDLGIALIPGAEISVTWGARTVHVVGLNLDIENPLLQAGLAGLMEFRAWRAEEIGRRLAKHGIDQAYEGARALSNGILIGRTHFARFLVGQRLAADNAEVFKRFLVSGKPGHVAGQWATLEAAVGWIRAAGGQAVIAHPARYGLTRTRIQRLLGEFRELGGAAVEVVTGSHSRDDAFTFARHAREQRLLASKGSDFHGPENPWLELGRLPPLPEGCIPIWHDWPDLESHCAPPLAALGVA